MGLRKAIHQILLPIAKSRIPYKTILIGSNLDNKRPVIYAVNHTNSSDMPIVSDALKRYCRILIAKQPLNFSDNLFFWLEGAIRVDRKDKQDTLHAKNSIIKAIGRSQSIVWYPEATWNSSENLLMLPMKWGIIDVAQKAGVSIVPLILDYDNSNMTCKILIGEALDPSGLHLKEGIRLLRDRMASMRWSLWEEKGRFSRRDIQIKDERALIKKDFEEYPLIDQEQEKSFIFCPKGSTAPEDAFGFMRGLTPNRENAFLYRGNARWLV